MAAARAAAAAATEEKSFFRGPGNARASFQPSESGRAEKIPGARRAIDGSMKSARQHDGFDVAAQYSCGN